MKNKISLYPTIASSEVLVQFTEPVTLDKHVVVTVPAEFFAIIYIDEKPLARMEACDESSVLKFVGRAFAGKSIKLAFARKSDLPYINWGFGNIDVKNDKLKETYRVGANGQYLLRILDAGKFIKSFGTDQNIDIEMLTSRTKLIITTVGRPILGKYFAGTQTSVFEINSLADDLRSKMFEAIKNELLFKDIGVELRALTLNGIHVDEEDMELIRSRINADGDTPKIASSELDEIKKEIIEAIKSGSNDETKDELLRLKEEVSRIADCQSNDAVLDEIDNLRVETMKAIKESKNPCIDIKSILDEISGFEDKVNKKIDSSITVIKDILENNADENRQRDIPLYETAKEEWLKELKLTTDLQLDKAQSDDDFAGVAGLIFSNVEYNLINKFKIPHKGKHFYMSKEEFNELTSTLKVGDKYMFKNTFCPKPIDNDGNVEMPVEIRFIKSRLTPEEAFQAAKDWTVLNKFRHRSDENSEMLKKILDERRMTKKEFLEYVIDSFRKLGIFTRD